MVNGKGKFPARIVMFRDGKVFDCERYGTVLNLEHLGVSEGQFLTVLREELPQVRDACNRVAQNYKPTLTYVIAGKRLVFMKCLIAVHKIYCVILRHHTRFYPVDAEGTDERNNGNPKSGTVVDKGVTGVYTFDFFLQSVCLGF